MLYISIILLLLAFILSWFILSGRPRPIETNSTSDFLSKNELDLVLGSIAHDFQEPIRTIIGLIFVIKNQEISRLSENSLKYIRLIEMASGRMQEMLTALLKYYRQTNFKVNGNSLINLNDIIRNVIKDVDLLIGDNNATIINPTLPEVKGNSLLLYHLWYNLILNAIKYRSSEPPKIIISCKEDRRFWVFDITDNGIGILHPEQVFYSGSLLTNILKPQNRGSGLLICKRIVEKHGGTIRAISELGQGTTFTFTILK